MKSDVEIAQAHELIPITQIAQNLGIDVDELEQYGKYKAKLPLSLIQPQKLTNSHLVLVSAISPTPAGEGKTTMSIGLSQGLNRIGKQTTVVLREPSLGPVFGMKGGAAGGGFSQVLPMEDINLHFTGDFSAIEKAHNLLAALIDNNLQSRSQSLKLDPRTIAWKRVMDMNDRALRNVTLGLGGPSNGLPRESGFDITAASEVMAILCLANDRADLKKRLGNIFVGVTWDKEVIYARDLHAPGAMTALLKDAIKPNLVQTLEGGPAIIHGGPFANIAQGTNSVLATKMGMSLSDFVVTEAGFGFDLGGEKFLNLKCQSSGIAPRLVVLVATIRALKYHGGVGIKSLKEENANAVEAGIPNLAKHIENIHKFGLEPIVAINQFTSDTEAEMEVVKRWCKAKGIKVAVADVWGQGGKGAEELAELVAESAINHDARFSPLYDWDAGIPAKIKRVATEIYGAADVVYMPKARKQLKHIVKLGFNHLPICIAKTQKSFSDNPSLVGRPEGFTLNVREIELAAGAGFVVPITGNMMRMPGLPPIPAANSIDIDENGRITGLF